MFWAAAVLGIVTVTLLVSWGAGRPVGGQLLLHAGVLALVVALRRGVGKLSGSEAGAVLAASTAIGAMFFLYMSLGHVAFTAIPWDGDPWVRAWDRVLFLGTEPAAAMAELLSAGPWMLEPLAFFYAMFIPYVYVSIFLGLVGRTPRVRSTFVLAFVLLYGASFMGYLFVPARGPVVAMTDVLTEPLAGGFFHGLVVSAVEAAGGPHGAFPSLHVGASTLAALVDLRHGDPLRGLIYVPLVLLICVATVALRYHYAVDVLVGAGLAYAALRVAEWKVRSLDTSSVERARP
jgi:membrane-associated phospholipid phosphatase